MQIAGTTASKIRQFSGHPTPKAASWKNNPSFHPEYPYISSETTGHSHGNSTDLPLRLNGKAVSLQGIIP